MITIATGHDHWRNPEIYFALNIDDPRFSRLNAQNIKINGRYSNNRVYFEDLIGLTTTGEYRGDGYLPVDFDLIKDYEDRWIESDPISMKFNSRTSSMEFLSPYFAYIDSINGEYPDLIKTRVNFSNLTVYY